MIVAAELELADRLGVTPRQGRLELDPSRGEHPGRSGDDGGAGAQHASRRLDLDGARVPRNARGRGGELDRQAGGELREQRADPLPAEGIDVALGGFGKIHGRHLAQRLAAPERPEHELDGRAPIAEILRKRLRA